MFPLLAYCNVLTSARWAIALK